MNDYEENIMESAAEVEALLISSIADLFAEVIIPYYGKTTRDGVKLGPKWWSQKLEAEGIIMTPNAIELRFRRSKANSEASRAEPTARYDRARTTLRNQTPERKAEIARELLNEPDVAEQVVQNKAARTSVSRATDEHYRKQAAERAQRTEQKTNADPVGQRIDSARAVNDLGEACERFSRDGNEALRRVGELPESERYWLTGAVDRAEATARAARRYLELGRSEIDTEINALLENGA